MKAGSETVGEYKAKVKRGSTCARPPVMKLDVPDARTAAPGLSRMRLHHRVHSRHLRVARGRHRLRLRQPRRGEGRRRTAGGISGIAQLPGLRARPSRTRASTPSSIAVPPRFHLDLTLRALEAGKHVLVEKPAFLRMDDYRTVLEARDRAGRVVLVGENDHYKPLAVTLRRLLAEGAIGEMVFAHFTTIAKRLKTADDWRNDEAMAGGDAFFEEGIHWLHLAGSLGPRITTIHGYRPSVSRKGPDTRAKSMMVAFRYDNDAVGSLYYSREIPSLLRGLRLSKLFGRDGIITFESNGLFVVGQGQAASAAACSRASATSAAIRRCIATSSGRSGRAARPR